MKITSIAVFLTLVGMLGCSTPQPMEPKQAPVVAHAVEVSPPHLAQLAPVAQIHPYLEPPSQEDLPEVFKGKPCQLGKSCLALDPRPFEICLLGSTKRCGDKMAEIMQVENPDAYGLEDNAKD